MTKADNKKKAASASTRVKAATQPGGKKSASRAAKVAPKAGAANGSVKPRQSEPSVRAAKSGSKASAKAVSTGTPAKKKTVSRKPSSPPDADWKRSVKRSTFSGKPDMVSRSIRMYPDQETELRTLAAENDRSLNGQIGLMVAWYFNQFEGEEALQPRGDHRPSDMVIYKQTSFQFRTRKETMDRLEALKPAFNNKLSPVVSAIIDEYLRNLQGRPPPPAEEASQGPTQ